MKFEIAKKDTSKLILFLAITFSLPLTTIAQISVAKGGIFYAKEFSKDIALYSAKTFVMSDVLGSTDEIIKFEVDPLAASSSGELTTLVYRCESKNKEGLILGFYGTRWNNAGTSYQAYSFKNLPAKEANELLDKIEKATAENFKYIAADNDNNNIYFHYQDLTILIYFKDNNNIKLRIYWNDFDSEWEWSTYKKTRKRLEKKLK